MEEDEECELDKMTSIIESKGGEVLSAEFVSTDENYEQSSKHDHLTNAHDGSVETDDFSDSKVNAQSKRKKVDTEIYFGGTIGSSSQMNEWDIDEFDLVSGLWSYFYENVLDS